MRSLPALLLLLGACSSLSTEQQQQLSQFQQNAKLYAERGDLDRALSMCDRGLEVSPDDYLLHSLHAGLLLRFSRRQADGGPQLLDKSLEEFAAVYATRSPNRHAPHLLFYYALARQQQGWRLTNQAALAHARNQQTEELDTAAAAEFTAAAGMLQALLVRGELKRLCHYHLMQIARLQNNVDEAITQGEEYLKSAKIDNAAAQRELDRTTVIGYEHAMQNALEELRQDEIEVRSFLGTILYSRKDYEKALPHVTEVLRLDSTRSNDYWNRYRILRALDRVEESTAGGGSSTCSISKPCAASSLT
jgi:tetratricopeptide (TPR) repeat protein